MLFILFGSGHYRPGDKHITYMLRFLVDSCLDLSRVEVKSIGTFLCSRVTQREARDQNGRGRELATDDEMKSSIGPCLWNESFLAWCRGRVGTRSQERERLGHGVLMRRGSSFDDN